MLLVHILRYQTNESFDAPDSQQFSLGLFTQQAVWLLSEGKAYPKAFILICPMRIVCKSTAMTLKGCSHSLSQTLNNASCGVSTDFTNFVKQCLHNARNALSLWWILANVSLLEKHCIRLSKWITCYLYIERWSEFWSQVVTQDLGWEAGSYQMWRTKSCPHVITSIRTDEANANSPSIAFLHSQF